MIKTSDSFLIIQPIIESLVAFKLRNNKKHPVRLFYGSILRGDFISGTSADEGTRTPTPLGTRS
jgi:hypothetical protein